MKIALQHLAADVLGLSAAARRALADGALAGLPVARRVEEIVRPEERSSAGERKSVAEAIAAGLAPLDPPPRVRTSLETLARVGTLAVVTGQQPGLFCSPLYSLYKALQACRLASELAGLWGVPVAPVFWNHADDHDVAEVHHAYLLNRNLDLQKVGLAGMSSGRQPIGRLVLDEETHRLGALRASVRQVYEEHPHVDDALELFAPRAGETLARAMTRAFTALLGDHGLVVVEPDWIRAPLSRALADIVAADPREALAIGARQSSESTGAAVAIDPATAALVYRVDNDGRRALRIGGEGFRYDDEQGSRTPAELAAEIVDDPPGWSAGALLRPLVQDAVFPVCAYVGGYGELAYHAQLGAAREQCGLPLTPFVPRISCTLVEPEVRAALARVDADLREVLAAGGQYEGGEGAAPEPPVFAKLRAAAEDARSAIVAHRAELAELEPGLAVNLKRAGDQARGLVDKVLQKAERVHANSSGKGKRQLRRLNNTLVPRGEPQERMLGPMSFTARHGRAWIEALYEELPAISAEHVAVLVEPEEPGGKRRLKLDVIVVGAHPDDAEISAGGTILRLVKAGRKVGIVDVTRGEMGTRGTRAERDAETAAANELLGVSVRENLEQPDGRVEVTIDARERLAALFRRYRPDAVLAHHVDDLHPDHVATGRLAREAWYLAGLRRLAADAGEEPHRPARIWHFMSHVFADPTMVVDIDAVWEEKVRVVRCYASQLAPADEHDDGRHFLFGADVLERMTNKARFFGERIGVRHGEPLLHKGPVPFEDPLVRMLSGAG